MPSVEKAILNPNTSLSVGDALMVAVCGLLVVFMMLAILAVVIMVISKVVGSMEGKGKAAPAPAKKAAAAPKPAAAPAAPAVDEGELVAVMMAAVAEESGMPMGSFLKGNGQSLGIRSYGACVDLLVTYFGPAAGVN